MNTEKVKLSTNKQVTVLDKVNGFYVVEYEGQIGYMEPDKISEKKIVGNSGNGNNGGSGNSGSINPGSTWTPPKM